jgi:hypothetical protein
VRPRGRLLRVEIVPGKVTYSLAGDEPLEITHRSGRSEDVLTLRPGRSVSRRWKPVKPRTPRPAQPPGREPHGLDTGSGSTGPG